MKNIYLPQEVKISGIEKLSSNSSLFRLKRINGDFSIKRKGLVFIPGQFVLAGIWGFGEAPFGIASSPYEKSYIDIVVRNTGGKVTKAIHEKKIGSKMTIRGPFGNGFPLQFFEGKDVVIASGGSGIPPVASLAEYIVANRKKFCKVYFLYGAKTPEDILMKKQMEQMEKSIEALLTVNNPDPSWNGFVGFVPELISKIKINPSNTIVAMCGPGPMMESIEKVFRPLGVSDRRIFVSEERKMHCGIGKCQHCTTGEKYVCFDGPVFNFDQIDKNWD